jgi:N-methylhydantoinase A
MLLGIDTGGTFTDFVLFDGQRLRVHKVLSTPDAPEMAVLQGVSDLGVSLGGLRVIHGSTVATNAVLEGKGARTVFVTNRGFGDLLAIGRQARRELYNLQPEPQAPPVPRDLCLETGGRLAADGGVIEDLCAEDLEALAEALRTLDPRAVAINLLFSFLDDRFERAVEGLVTDDVFVSRSSAVLPEYREYERGITTWLNAYVGPLVSGYLERLAARLAPARVSVMQSSGETIGADQAGGQGVRLLLSGPAGGLAGARFIGETAGKGRLLSFDMGGTSTDVALIDGDLRLTSEGTIGHYPVAVPMVDMHTIGAGGGSIARVDAGGLLRVGPESAGAAPGPACYGQGGRAPTVTDANLVLGRLVPEAFLGGAMRLDATAAREAVGGLGHRLGLSAEAAAEGIVRVANEHMSRALRVISVHRGVDPRAMTLVSFGGAGGLHVCALAEALGMRRALAPIHAGVLSALGMLVAPPGRQLSRTVNGLLADMPAETIEAAFDELAATGLDALAAEGVDAGGVTASRSLDLRYEGQSYTLTLSWEGAEATAEAFHAAHARRYGHRMEVPVELVNLRLAVHGQPHALDLAGHAGARTVSAVPATRAPMYGVGGQVPAWAREALVPGQALTGAGLITETVATTYLAPGWRCLVDDYGNLLLERESR